MKEKWLIDLAHEAEYFVWGFIDWIRSVKYLKQQEKYVLMSNINIPKQCRIWNTCFTYVAVIGGKLFWNNPMKNNRVHKDEKYLLSVIITLGKNVSGGDAVFIMEL